MKKQTDIYDILNALTKREKLEVDTRIEITGESLTKQEFKEESDINVMVKRFMLGYETDIVPMQPQYIDNTAVPTFEKALNYIIQAQDYFEDLPLDIRKRFNYDPKAMLEFVNDPKNQQEAVTLGLIEPPAPTAQAPSHASAPLAGVDTSNTNNNNNN